MSSSFVQLEEQEDRISCLISQLPKKIELQEKISLLEKSEEVFLFWEKFPEYKEQMASFSQREKYFFLILVVLKQELLIQEKPWKDPSFFSSLEEIENFYLSIGGLLGYQKTVLDLLQKEKKERFTSCQFFSPPYFDIATFDDTVKKYVEWGIEALPYTAEIYPLGGAADRLHLVDEKTKEELPAAKLTFCGKTLLEHLISDLRAREFLYFQKHKKQIITPIVLMTSEEKKNQEHIEAVLEEKNFFGRPKSSFFWVKQPLVPAVDETGKWVQKEKGKLLLKPSGHGALWKLMQEKGAFEWLAKQNRKKALVRQINNPIAGIDYGILAFLGIGYHFDMHFGFASCPKAQNVAEGLDILVERKKEKGFEYFITNIEYCEIDQFSIEEENTFLANTNLLLADLKTVQKAVEKNPFPGLLLNLKEHKTSEGIKKIGRLETTMQNISDEIQEESKKARKPPKTEKTFITYNQRSKTISTTKKVYKPGHFFETPEKCFYDFYKNHHELLQSHCKVKLPPLVSFEEMMEKGPSFFFQYDPSLGPLYETIAKKIKKGELLFSSYLACNLESLLLEEVSLAGACILEAEEPLGSFKEGLLLYQEERPSCVLYQVKIENKGVDLVKSRPFWKKAPCCIESLTIKLKQNSSFFAEKVTFTGSHHFIVEEGEECTVFEKKGKILIERKRK